MLALPNQNSCHRQFSFTKQSVTHLLFELGIDAAFQLE
jgi:hypothetical protein